MHDAQGILAAEATPGGGARLRITLLAAGFVLGPSGSSVREIIATTGADIRSWSEAWHEQGAGSGAGSGGAARSGTKIRTFVVEVGAASGHIGRGAKGEDERLPLFFRCG